MTHFYAVIQVKICHKVFQERALQRLLQLIHTNIICFGFTADITHVYTGTA